jgi:uncharacterized repeat protein (TIGR01451 family)
MKKRAVFVFVIICFVSAVLGWRPLGTGAGAGPESPWPVTRTAIAFAESLPISELVKNISYKTKYLSAVSTREPLSNRSPGAAKYVSHDTDASIARVSAVPMPTPSLSFDGLTNFDNIDAYGLVIIPPDITGDVGPEHYFQAVNSVARVFDKSGSPLTPPFKLPQIFGPLGTPCSTRFDGDPIILYDPLADRWMLSQYCTAFPPFRQLIAISRTGDPTGAYFLYEFVMPNVRLNDFPKLGVWPDGYYMSTEEYLGSDFTGTGMFAFDRNKMLAGDPTASYIYFSRASNSAERRNNMLPSDLDGIRPPAPGTPNIFVSYMATEYGDAQDAIRIFDFHADFAEPANSTFTERPESPIAVAAFDPTSLAGRADISQPAPGEKLDSNSDRVNYRVAYRNFGSKESLVFNQTVRLTQSPAPYRAGVRLYELQRNGASPFAATEQTTIGDSVSSRWIGSAAQDHQGNVAVSYNFVADEKKPAILYTGRLASEPAGTFRTEASLVDGDGVQKAFGWRWGDYAAMTVDPVDDCTFWTSGEYYTLASQNYSDFTWLTRIGRFKFDECTPAPRSVLTGTVTDASNSQPIAGAKVTALAYSRNTAANGSYGNMLVLPGSYSVTASAHGYRSESINISVTDGQTATQNFALQPVAVIKNAGLQILAESCAANGSPEPGETVTYAVLLRNTGSLDTQALTATLLASGGVTVPSEPQNYGILTSNGPSVSRSFTFTVSSAISCGSPITLTLQLQDGAENLGTITITLMGGIPKIAFQQNFDRNQQAQLPPRWIRSAENIDHLPDYPRNWIVSPKRSVSGPKSAFSPDLNQVGINEMITPVFRVDTPNARLTFQNWYELETTFLRNRLYDGSVLEIKFGTNKWQDILAAGGTFESGGYDGIIDSCCSNPLGGRPGWSGRSGVNQTSEFITTAVRLPATAAGQMVQLRWRIGTDVGTFREGQYIDDIQVTDGYNCGCSGLR